MHAVALVAGAAAGLLGSFKFSYSRGALPIGLLVTLPMTVVVFAAAGLLARSRVAALTAAAGWLVVVGLFSVQRPEGDLVVPATTYGFVWLLGGTVAAGLAIAVPYEQLPVGRATRQDPSGAEPNRR